MATSVVRFEEETKQAEGAIRAACAKLGYSFYEKKQKEILKNVLIRKDLSVFLPAGGEKNLLR